MQTTVALMAALVVAVVFLAAPTWRKAWRSHEVALWETGLIYGPAGFVEQLGPGIHRRFDPLHRRTLVCVPTVTRALSGQTIEAISKDQFAFRLTLTPVVTVVDPRLLVEQTTGPSGERAPVQPVDHRYDRLSPSLAAAALAVVATRTLEEFLADPAAMVTAIAPQLADALPGTRLDELLLTGITLPPEVRKMFTEVERARREGLAGLERARAEQASLRALANAARNLADNPALANLRMLQVMENARGAKTFVLGGGVTDPGKAPAAADAQSQT